MTEGTDNHVLQWPRRSRRRGTGPWWSWGLILGAMFTGVLYSQWRLSSSSTSSIADTVTSRVTNAQKPHLGMGVQDNTNAGGTETSPMQASKLQSVFINPGPDTPRVDTGLVQADGTAISVSCSTCHTTRTPDNQNQKTGDLQEFHQTIDVVHGNVSCLSCHHDQNYDQLKLADGRSVEYRDVMTLCAQCHGPQMTDYLHGAHGGMNGYWDLSRGPQQRNNCVDCHHPHRPQIPTMFPTFKPRDRFLPSSVHQEKGHE